MTFSVDKDEMRPFTAILLVSGYSVVPPRPMMWEQSEDIHNGDVSQLMNSNRFDTFTLQTLTILPPVKS